MLSYMLPVDEKPPPAPAKGHLQLALGPEPMTNGRVAPTPISKETSISSFVSDATTTTASHSSMTTTSSSDRSKQQKIAINGTKHQTLKRVSFGSSKGSMVETLIYESPLHEEPEPSPIAEHPMTFPEDLDQTETEREKVRVTFFQQSKPQEVDLPNEPLVFSDPELMMAAATLNETNHVAYIRQESTESGWDNPFRPGGDLSREADEIVELIKGGKPITPTSLDSPSPPPTDQNDSTYANNVAAREPITESPKKATHANAAPNAATPRSANGNVKNEKVASPGSVDVQRGTLVPAGDASQVEHVVIKKKPKCKCCVIQ